MRRLVITTITNSDAVMVFGFLGAVMSFITLSILYLTKILKDKKESVTVEVKLDRALDDIQKFWEFKSEAEQEISSLKSNCNATHSNHKYIN